MSPCLYTQVYTSQKSLPISILDTFGFRWNGNAIKTTSNASYAATHDERQLQFVFGTGFSESLPQLPGSPSEWLFPTLFSVSPNAERATCNRCVMNAIYSGTPP
jgi:hypothetical protein